MVKNLPVDAGDKRDTLSPWAGRCPGAGNSNPLQYSGLGNPKDRGAWQATIHGVAESWTRLSGWAHTHTHTEEQPRVPFPLQRLTQQWFWSASPVLAARIWQWLSQNFRSQGTLKVIQLGPDSAEEGWNLDKIIKMLKILHLVNLGIGARKKQ